MIVGCCFCNARMEVPDADARLPMTITFYNTDQEDVRVEFQQYMCADCTKKLTDRSPTKAGPK